MSTPWLLGTLIDWVRGTKSSMRNTTYYKMHKYLVLVPRFGTMERNRKITQYVEDSTQYVE